MSHGTWQTTSSSGGLLVPAACVGAGVLLAGGGTVAAVTGFLTSLVEVLGAIVIALIGLVALVAVLAYRRGWRPSLRTVVVWNPHAVEAAQEASQVAGRAARALPAPQTVNNYFFNATPEQMAEVVRRQAITGER